MEENQNNKLIVVNEDAWFLDTAIFEQTQRAAQMMMSAKMLPIHYRDDLASCAIAMHQSLRMGLQPLEFMQQTYVVSGKVGLNSALCIALANRSGIFKDVLQYEFSGKGDALTCTAQAVTSATGITCESTCSVQDAKDMGWWGRNGSPWPKQTKQMLRYRSATRLIKTYCPEVLMGLDSAEELKDSRSEILAEEKNITEEVNAATTPKAATPKKKAKKPPEPEVHEQVELHQDVARLQALCNDPKNKPAFDDLFARGETDHHEIRYTIENNVGTEAAKIVKHLMELKHEPDKT